MKDVLYCGVTLIFFALMLAYGYACRELGRELGREFGRDGDAKSSAK